MDNKSECTKNRDVCEVQCVHCENVLKVKNNMKPEELLFDLAELFKVFGDTTRVKILFALAQTEMCVCDISEALSMTQSAVSHQLRILRHNKLVKNRKEGKIVYYSLDDEHVSHIFNQAIEHLEHKEKKM